MKSVLLVSTAALAAGVFSSSAVAQQSAQGFAEVTVQESTVTIQGNPEDIMDFGVVTRSGDNQTIPSASGEGFVVSGLVGQTYTLSFTDGVMAVGSEGVPDLTITNFSTSLPGVEGTLDSEADSVIVNAELLVPANTPAGNYSGEYTVTVNNP